MARMGERRCRVEPHARRTESMECGKRSLVGAASHRARVRSEVRSHARRSLPARRDLPAMAAGQATARLPLRSTGSHNALRTRAHLLVGIERLLRWTHFFRDM